MAITVAPSGFDCGNAVGMVEMLVVGSAVLMCYIKRKCAYNINQSAAFRLQTVSLSHCRECLHP